MCLKRGAEASVGSAQLEHSLLDLVHLRLRQPFLSKENNIIQKKEHYTFCPQVAHLSPESRAEPVFLNVYGAQESINSASLCNLAGRYDNPIPTRCLAPIDCLKITAQSSDIHEYRILIRLCRKKRLSCAGGDTVYIETKGLIMELNLQSLFGLHVHSCTY